MVLVRQSCDGKHESYFSTVRRPTEIVSPLILLQARFQQKQLQEKEEKLLKLYEEQQKRALKSVGSRSGGSSVSSNSSVGAGKVRFLLQSRRRTSETKHGVAITGRDKSYPLKPLPKNSFGKNLEFHHNQRDKKDIVNWERDLHQRSISLDRHNLNPHLGYDCIFGFNAEEEDQSRVNARSGDRGTAGVRTNFTYCEQSHANLKNLDELIFRRSFHILNDHSQKRKTDFSKSRNGNYDVEEAANYPLSNFTNNRKLYVNSLESENINQTNFSCKLSAGEPTTSQSFNGKMEGKFRNYVSQSMAPKKLNGPSVSRTLGERNELTGRQEGKESASFDLSNGNVTSPVRKIRKPTPVPLSVAPTNLFQREAKKPSRIESIREVPSPPSPVRIPASRTQSTANSKSLNLGSKTPVPSRPPSAKLFSANPSTASPSPSNLINCRICGRNFASDRVSKHEEICQKSTKSKRKPFDALQQRVKGTEAEKYIRKSTKTVRSQPEKIIKPQSNWRKKHEDFINNIRAAKEVSAHLKKGGKLSDLPPPPPSDYSDYIQCPHCSRKFNEAAAQRHIPKCANIINNKPKPGTQKNAAIKQGSKLLQASPAVRGRK